MKNILMLVHTFPPRGSVGGSIRLIKFLKYIKELRNDIRCTILTIRDDIVLLNDPHLSEMSLSEIPYEITHIIKTNTFQPRHKNNKNKTPDTNEHITTKKQINRFNSFKKSIYNFFDKYFLIPDYGILWFPFSIRAAIKLIKENDIDLIYATAPPFSVLIQAVVISKLTGKKIVIDIKDDWIHQTKFLNRPLLPRKFEERLEQFCIKNTDKIILVTPDSFNDFTKRYPQYKSKFELISNGCDIEEYKRYWDISREPYTKFTIIHSGIITNSRNPSGFLNALYNLKEEGIISYKNFEMRFIGFPQKEIVNIISDKGLNDLIIITEPLEREDFIRSIVNADLLLAFNYQIKTLIPGKLYDYWGSRRPILLIDSPKSMAAKLINENKLGIVRDFEDEEGIKTSIKYYFQLWSNNCLDNKTEVGNLHKFDRKNLTGKLIKIIEAI